MGGFLQLARPLNCLMSAGGVLVGGLVAVGPEAWRRYAGPLALAALAAGVFTAGGNALNDLADRETDRRNHPERPLPSGRVSVRGAEAFVAATIAAAFGLGFLASPWCFALVGVNAAVLVAYEAKFKARGGSGNLLIAYLVGSLFLFAGAAVVRADLRPVLRTGTLALLAFLATAGREITKDIEDMAGDVDRRTLPQRVGPERAGRLAALALGAGVLLSLVPWYLGILSFPYLLAVVPADGMFIYAARYSATRPARSQRVTKYAMLVALVAFLAGGLL